MREKDLSMLVLQESNLSGVSGSEVRIIVAGVRNAGIQYRRQRNLCLKKQIESSQCMQLKEQNGFLVSGRW